MPAGKPPGKPFLGDDDLNSELEAWDATFDALHAGPEVSGQLPAAPVMDWPAPAEPDPTQLTAAAPPDPGATFEDFDPAAHLDADLEAQLTLDGAAVAPEPREPAGSAAAWHDDDEAEREWDLIDERDDRDPAADDQAARDPAALDQAALDQAARDRAAHGFGRMPSLTNVDPLETDFSDVGAAEPPAALGDLLGRGPTTEERLDDDDDEVFTSASRPRRVTVDPYAPLDEDPLAPPPAPAPPPARREPPPPPRVRSSPAIVRRVTAPQPSVQTDDTPSRGVDISMFAEQTRVIGAEEIEPHASASRHATSPPIEVDEDAYDDIEIGAAAPEPLVTTESSPVRRTAHTIHVVRRADTPTRPPPIVVPVERRVLELDDDDDGGAPAVPTPMSEDDFSDVAAAVGADDLLDAPPPPRPGTFDLDAEPPPPVSLDDAFVGLDDDDEPPLPVIVEEPEPELELDRPPALADFYPRVKTPTSVPPLGRALLEPAPEPDPARALAPTPRPARLDTLRPTETPELEPTLDLDAAARAWPEQVAPLPTSELDEACAAALLVYEREVATLDDDETSAALRIEAGRLCERLADLERARVHYDAALLADPRATAALRGLRRIARASGDLEEVTRQLDIEIAVAGALERRPLGHYRIDLLMASGEQDLARVAVGEMLDSARSDTRALLAQLELAFLDGRADEFGSALEQIAHAVTDHELRAAVQGARGALAAHHSDTLAATTWFAAAAESDPQSLAARLGAVRQAAAQADAGGAAHALVELARRVADPVTAAAAAVRALQWEPAGELAAVATEIAVAVAPDDPLVARLAAEVAPGEAGQAYARWAAVATEPAVRAYAAARAAELDPGSAAPLWSIALRDDPGDDHGAAQLRTAHVAVEATQGAIEVDLALARDPDRERARLRAAYGLIGLGQLDGAIELLVQGRANRPASLAIAEALGEALAAAGRWSERAQLLSELASEPGDQLDRDVAHLRSAIAWEEAVSAAAAAEAPFDEVQRLTAAALEAWERVLEHDPKSPSAHGATIVLANRLGDREVVFEALSRAQAATDAPYAAASLAFRRARLVADDLPRAESLLRDIQPLDDPRRTVARVTAAARAQDLAEAAAALEERASQLRGSDPEAAALRLRAAQLALDAGEAARATVLLQHVEQALPTLGVVPDLLAAARRRAGDRPSASQLRRRDGAGASTPDAFARVVRDADLAASHGDLAAALALYQRALELRPGDPLATVPLIRIATELREPAPISTQAYARLHAAEEAGDGVAKAVAYELLALIDAELRDDTSSAQIALESAAQADPTRIDLMHRLERLYAAHDDVAELLRLRKAELDAMPPELVRDRVALQLDVAGLAARDRRPELELAELYRAVIAIDPKTRLALMHLESIVRRGGGAGEELAVLEEQIASYFEGDPKAEAAFWTRAGETLAELGQIDAAVQRFGRADAALSGHVFALEGWRQAALKGELWVDVAEAASRQAAGTTDPVQRGALHHLAGVALMDKALVGEQAIAAFRKAVEANPEHRDAFLRLRILLEEDANHDELAIVLAHRLEVEPDATARIELHRALAELHRNFLSDRETATHHYRAILEADPNDLRSHAAIADIAWEQGNWQDAAEALMARARLEREPEILKTLCFRLGLIYADRLVDVPMALKAFQRALTYQPDDEATLVRLADLAAQIGEWKLALGACERLVKHESDPDRRVAHLHRVARIFRAGFGDVKRAERALNLALDSSPTNDEALAELVQFYRDANDITSARVHLNRVAGGMRARVAQDPTDGVPYRVIARAMVARANTNVPGSLAVARAAAELADLLGAAGEPERRLLVEPPRPDLSLLGRPDADELLFPRGVQPELRQVFKLLGDRIAKHVGINIQAYGVSRGDRVRAKDNAVAAVAQSVATGLGFGDIDVYISNRQPWVMVAEPTSPVSLVLGASIVGAGGDAIRFAAGGALKMAQASLAIPARLPADDLGVLVVALLRLFQPEFPMRGVDADAVATQYQKLRRLVPTGLVNELRPFALAIDPQRFGHVELSRDLRITAVRAGLVAAGSILAGLRILASQAGGAELPGFLADPVAQGLVSFALGEDHAALAR